MMIKIWERYFLKETLKTFCLFIFCFYGLFVLVDYASHAASFHRGTTSFQWKIIGFYYLLEFIKRLEVLVPFALLLATVKTLTTLNVHNELVALMTSGVKLKKLMRPFLLLGLFFTALLYLNTELLLPHVLKQIKHMDNARSLLKHKNRNSPIVRHLILEDGSTLLFQNYDSTTESFFDAYWIKSVDSIYRIKFLFPNKEQPYGQFVDQLKRVSSGELKLEDSYSEKSFPEIKFNKQTLFETITSPEEQSYSELWAKTPSIINPQSEKQSQLVTMYFYKLVMPWLCLLAVIGPMPYCIKFTRNLPLFYIYAWSIFGLVAFYIIMDAALVLGERQALSPTLAIWPIFGFFMIAAGWRYQTSV